MPLRAEDLDLLNAGRDCRTHLHHAGIEAAGIGVDLAQGIDLDRKGMARDRVFVRIKPLVAGLRGIGPCAAAIAHRQPRRFCRAAQGRPAQFGRMGIACHFAAHGAQAKAFGGIVAGGFEASVVEDQCL